MESDQMICPWCDTEIVWDPEIGRENECPHCLNELGQYRSMKLNIENTDSAQFSHRGKFVSMDENDDDYDEYDEYDEQDDADPDDGILDESYISGQDDYAYEQSVQLCLAEQQEAPECHICRELMLHTGEQVPASGYCPVTPVSLGVPIIAEPPKVNVFVCPTCFRVEYSLCGEDRVRMIEVLRQHFDPKK